jgi:hypothetical protein
MSEPPYIKIWSRRSEWDYRWTGALRSPAEIILCSIFEHGRCALACLPERFSFPSREEDLSSALPHLLVAAKSNIVGPIFFLSIHCPPCFNYPLDPYRVARKQARFDPETVLRLIDDFSNPLLYQDIQIRLPPDAPRAVAENILAEMRKRFSSGSGPLAGPKRGAGARVRQAKVALKNLGALKLRHLMSAPDAIRYTEKILGRPLFGAESQWSRARKHAEETLRPYHAEAAALLEASREKRSFSRLSCSPDGKLEVDWTGK